MLSNAYEAKASQPRLAEVGQGEMRSVAGGVIYDWDWVPPKFVIAPTDISKVYFGFGHGDF